MITPLAMFWVAVARLLRMKMLVIVVKIRTPSTEPMMRAAAAGEQRAADDRRPRWRRARRGRRACCEPVVVRAMSMTAAMPQHSPDEHVEQDGVPLDVDAGQPGGLGVAADGERAAAERRAVEQDPAERRRRRAKMHDQQRDAEDVAGGEVDDRLVCDDLGRGSARCRSARPRALASIASVDDERHELAVGDEHAVDQAAPTPPTAARMRIMTTGARTTGLPAWSPRPRPARRARRPRGRCRRR